LSAKYAVAVTFEELLVKLSAREFNYSFSGPQLLVRPRKVHHLPLVRGIEQFSSRITAGQEMIGGVQKTGSTEHSKFRA
jgi:hypothetical protein